VPRGRESGDWVAADLGDRADLERGAERAVAVFGEPDILVNSAGVNPAAAPGRA